MDYNKRSEKELHLFRSLSLCKSSDDKWHVIKYVILGKTVFLSIVLVLRVFALQGFRTLKLTEITWETKNKNLTG